MPASPMERPNIVDVDILFGAEGRHDDREADCCLRSGDGNHDERKDVADVMEPEACVGDQEQVRGVEHQFDAHQHNERIAPNDHTEDADEKNDGSEGHIVIDRNAHQPLPSRRIASRTARSARMRLCCASASVICSPPKVMTPITATINTSAVASKGSSCTVKSALPKSATLPKTSAFPTAPVAGAAAILTLERA